MNEIIRQHHISFKNAFAGLKWALLTQPNFRVHFFLSVVAIGIGIYVQLAIWEWVVIVLTIFWGLAAEMINTALESITDLVTQEWRQEAKIAKDVAAGMMLTVAIGAVIVAALILLPKILIKV
ncbi:MAG: Diacylglycerol kinase [Candidatus Gottesmanbacteria bacterium GW2011_GWB1_43_11]|uniref:Diacylglycerol kinase n=1 Tax=Candidatus Gottesmanbacteria bacterium GW2011_GWB1_43_11 TaxID=1618446 RepID=A0A0G1FKU3_9BACT|nr:MAG: Diacylglycerol kinase [Candidatus Gottesmanbacteria bacterium GW2011_GWA2_42_16]KKS56331.1 MAG: Diacylglycerol kinase [Candidatus Gottesmanbacteria bacterium GW2011_GWA1_42_26]KKS82339.1 MAG: Diacylglycerol kinase [Candidatus Gottesmanbacteria bacterium GW2011_GWC1_43_10]KKS87533.1 MAG: Diacylglycerol kinase [Candidatus Gottesmanbacteria bacterium GW2011_GWB1_43_11]OGG10348.1 MAG: hypothetical protein A2699_00885 [Candidatus Gottesmanbacteria bacterium RIFCSPHIGHO2_01_FULL_43_15]OGG247